MDLESNNYQKIYEYLHIIFFIVLKEKKQNEILQFVVLFYLTQ